MKVKHYGSGLYTPGQITSIRRAAKSRRQDRTSVQRLVARKLKRGLKFGAAKAKLRRVNARSAEMHAISRWPQHTGSAKNRGQLKQFLRDARAKGNKAYAPRHYNRDERGRFA